MYLISDMDILEEIKIPCPCQFYHKLTYSRIKEESGLTNKLFQSKLHFFTKKYSSYDLILIVPSKLLSWPDQ